MKTKALNRKRAVAVMAAATVLAIAAFAAVRAHESPPPAADVRLYTFDLGKLRVGDVSRFNLSPQEIKPTEFFAVVGYLIVHPKGKLIWDTGVVPDADVGTGAPGADRAGRKLVEQLASAGFTPHDITYLALSHYHNDHTANANLFAGATWLVPRAERDAMFADPPPRITNPKHYDLLRNARTRILDQEEYDVFGDGRVIVKSAPGHTPGHQVLVLRLKETGPVVLAGDLYHFVEERRLRDRVPSFEFDKQQSIASRNAIEAYAAKIGAQVWVEHDYAAFSSQRKAPNAYR